MITLPPENKAIYVEPAMYNLPTKHVRECDVNCVWTRDWNITTLKYASDAFISDPYPILNKTFPHPKYCPHQRTLLFTAENLDKNEFEPKFDINIYSRSDGDAHVGYFGYQLLEKPIKKKKDDVLISAYISNCFYRVSSDRLRIIKELRKYIKIDVFGKCFNKKEPEEFNHLGFANRKIENIGRYKFHLAFENSKDEGYISEKIWQSFYAGTVPIYLGAPNIRKFLPRQNAALIVDEFPSIEALANEIKRIGSNEIEYQRMFEWRKKVDDSFLNVMDYECLRNSCKICHKVADILDQKRITKLHSKRFHLYIRPLNMYRYKIIYPKQPITLQSLLDQLYEMFKDYQPRWQYCIMKHFRKYHDIHNFRVKISKIIKSNWGFKQKILDDGIDSDQKIKKLKSGEKLEVIFV